MNREIPSLLGENSRTYWTCPFRSHFPPVATVGCRAWGNKSKLRKWAWKGGVSFLSISSMLYLTLENHYLSLISVLSFVKDSGGFGALASTLHRGRPPPPLQSTVHHEYIWALFPAEPRGASEPFFRGHCKSVNVSLEINHVYSSDNNS